MAKQVKIKDIARMAGVSAGTVDRVLHNRGKVSESSRAAVEKVLSEVGYRYNIHASAISVRKEFKITVSTPTINKGEYWGSIGKGFEKALNEYSDISIDCLYFPYNQFDINSCREAYKSVAQEESDIVILGATYIEETRWLCNILDTREIPYIFVDSAISGTQPLATFTVDQIACGKLVGRLLDTMTPSVNAIAILGTQRIGNMKANNSLERKKGLKEYLSTNNPTRLIKEASFSVMNNKEGEDSIIDFLQENTDIKGIGVLNSRGHLVADILKKHNINDIHIVSFDLTDGNSRCLNEGHIAAVLCQRPENQGFQSIKTAINHLLYKNVDRETEHIMQIDVIYKESLPYYSEITR